ncbi:MAG: GAF domain-containing protein [Phycisphaerales bacterium JB040]
MNTPPPPPPSPSPSPAPQPADRADERHEFIAAEIPARVLAVSMDPRRLELVERAVAGRCVSMHVARTPEQALATLAATGANLLVIDRRVGEHDGVALAARVLETSPEAVPLIASDEPSLDDAVLAMRTGAADLIGWDASPVELRRRIAVAAARAESLRRRAVRMERLQKLCGTLDHARSHVTGQVGDLCQDLLGAYQTLADQIGDVSLTSELNSLLRQELEVESLLRTMLEFLLSRIGTTNAAVFLPSSDGDFSLGAYINYNCPRESVEVLLDEMANTFAPRFEDQGEPLVLRGERDLHAILGDSAAWMGESEVLVVSCVEDGECLAVLTVFRQTSRPFTPEQRRIFELSARLFSAQLGRVIRVHHRHQPELLEDSEFEGYDTDWNPLTDLDEFDEGDDYGLAA